MLLIYPYKKSDKELLYSIRSFEKYFSEPIEVAVYGDKPIPPLCISDKLIYQYVEHHSDWDGDQNIGNILGHVTADDWLDDLDFLWMNDDIYLLQPTDLSFFDNPYQVQDLNHIVSPNPCPWVRKLWDTYDMVIEHGGHGYNYESHMPHKFNMGKLRELCKIYPVINGCNLIATAYYGMFFKGDPVRYEDILKIYCTKNPNKILPTDTMLNHNQEGYTDYVKSELATRFPDSDFLDSPFEHIRN